MAQVEPQGRQKVTRTLRTIAAFAICLIFLLPIIWMLMTAFKSRKDIVSIPPRVIPVESEESGLISGIFRGIGLEEYIFKPTLEGFVFLFTQRSTLTKMRMERLLEERDDFTWWEQIAVDRGLEIIGPSQYASRVRNSLIIAGGSTVAAVVLGIFSAYAFSRFRIPGESDLLFFILSTRMLPPVVVTIPIFLMFRRLGLFDTHLGLITLYTAFNLSLTVWLLKGFIDEIPREYEEAALVDGYTRWQAFIKIVLPQAVTGIAATTVFALIFAWNEYAFALMLTSDRARTAPPSIPSVIGTAGVEWAATAAGSLLFLIPVVIIAFALRKYLIRGITFGAIRQ